MVRYRLAQNFGQKITLRLNDERRSQIKVGDFIVFANRETEEKIKAQVINIYHYKNFHELYKNHSKTQLGYLENEDTKPEDMLFYYTQDRIDKYGVLGIEIKLDK